MILAAGLGTRLRPLSLLRPKPAMPVQGRPVIAYLLEWLRHAGVREVMINRHHLPDELQRAVEMHCPADVTVSYSDEETPLGTGGGIRRAAHFLRESDPCIVLAGDMLLDLDIQALVAQHRERRSDCTLVLRSDPRLEDFGSIGIDEDDRLCRIAQRFDLGGETRSGLFVGVRLFSPRVFESMPDVPESEPFEDLRDWLAPLAAAAPERHAIRGALLAPADCVWEPVGTPAEYLGINLTPPRLSFLTADQMPAPGTLLLGPPADTVVGAGARLGERVQLKRSVVWDSEIVPAGLRGEDGVFAGGTFYPCVPHADRA
jgi:mannose-1-phosphate guanylyltransferase